MAKIITRSGAGSSAVRRLTYSQSKGRMAVTYRSGKTYTYDGISKQRFTSITKASSLGKAINKMKGKLGGTARLVKSGPGGLKSAMRARKRGGKGSGGGRRCGASASGLGGCSGTSLATRVQVISEKPPQEGC